MVGWEDGLNTFMSHCSPFGEVDPTLQTRGTRWDPNMYGHKALFTLIVIAKQIKEIRTYIVPYSVRYKDAMQCDPHCHAGQLLIWCSLEVWLYKCLKRSSNWLQVLETSKARFKPRPYDSVMLFPYKTGSSPCFPRSLPVPKSQK